MRSKITVLTAMLLVLALALSACGSGRPPESEIVPSDYDPYAEETYVPAEDEIVAADPVDEYYAFAAEEEQDQAEEDLYSPASGGEEQAYTAPVDTRGDINIGLVLTGEAVLHPLKCVYRDMISLNGLVFESMLTLDDSHQPVGQLCDSWKNDGARYVFHIRQGVTFHNGEPLTAEDVVASYNYIKAVGASGPWYDRIATIDSMKAISSDSLGVVFTFAGMTALNAMTFPVVQRDTLDYALPMGTGPYWYISYSVNKCVRLERNPLWWKKAGASCAESIVGWRYKNTGAALQALLTGEIDTLATRSVQASLYKKLTDYHTINYTTNTYDFLVPNLKKGPVKDVRVRRALMYAIDRTAIASTVYGGLVQESEVPVIPGSYLYETQAAIYNYSPELALQMLYDTGRSDSNSDGMLDSVVDGLLEYFTIRIITYNDSTDETRTKAAELIATQLKKIGVNVEVTTLTQDKLLKRIKDGDYDLALISVNLSADGDLTSLLRNDGKRNYSGYASTGMNDLLSRARNADTLEALTDIYSRIQLQVVEELPFLGLYFRTGTLVSRENISAMHGISECDTFAGMENVEP